MAVPRNRHSNERKNIRRRHHAKKAQYTDACTNCGQEFLPHTVCAAGGFYNSKAVMTIAKE